MILIAWPQPMYNGRRMAEMKMLSVVMPVFNAAATLESVVQELLTVLPGIASEYEVILVNDGSQDESWAIIQSLASRDSRVRGLDLARNFGQHNATLAGVRSARYDYTITMDADGQHPPQAIVALVEMLEVGYDVVYGYPRSGQHGTLRNVITKILKQLSDVCGLFPDTQKRSAFRAMRTHLREAFANNMSPYVSLDTWLQWSTDRFGFIATAHRPRQAGESASSYKNLHLMVFNALTGHSIALIRFIEWIGLLMMVLGVGLALVAEASVMWITGVIVTVSGVMLLAIALVGEYVARYYHAVIGKPQTMVRHQTERKL